MAPKWAEAKKNIAQTQTNQIITQNDSMKLIKSRNIVQQFWCARSRISLALIVGVSRKRRSCACIAPKQMCLFVVVVVVWFNTYTHAQRLHAVRKNLFTHATWKSVTISRYTFCIAQFAGRKIIVRLMRQKRIQYFTIFPLSPFVSNCVMCAHNEQLHFLKTKCNYSDRR